MVLFFERQAAHTMYQDANSQRGNDGSDEVGSVYKRMKSEMSEGLNLHAST